MVIKNKITNKLKKYRPLRGGGGGKGWSPAKFFFGLFGGGLNWSKSFHIDTQEFNIFEFYITFFFAHSKFNSFWNQWQHLLSASANALRILNNKSDLRISFHKLHKIHKRSLPLEMMKYCLSIQLYKVYNDSNMSEIGWIWMYSKTLTQDWLSFRSMTSQT